MSTEQVSEPRQLLSLVSVPMMGYVETYVRVELLSDFPWREIEDARIGDVAYSWRELCKFTNTRITVGPLPEGEARQLMAENARLEADNLALTNRIANLQMKLAHAEAQIG